MNERGQLVIPEEIRKELGIGNATTLILIERGKELILRRERDVLERMEEDSFWNDLGKSALKGSWSKEDAVWDSIYRAQK